MTTAPHPAPTAPAAAPPGQDKPVATVRSLDGYRALNPANGLFLRAEHLSTMQSYARDLAFTAARATGTGIVHGFGVSLAADSASILVEPGLAVTRSGQLLRSQSTIVVPLDAEHLEPLGYDGFWLVELRADADTSGSAPVYGSLCDDACSDQGRAIHVWRDEGVQVRLSADSLAGLENASPDDRRNWLASAYFERERAVGPPWLVPAGPGAGVDPLPDHTWDDGSALPPDAGVPLAVLQNVAGRHVLDVWTARRLVDGPVAQATWRSRLAMRPWTVFLAQVLQFQAELADTGSSLGPQAGAPAKLVLLDVEVEETLREPVTKFLGDIANTGAANWRSVQELAAAAQKSHTQRGAVTAMRSLRGLGMLELPPAGYLAVDERQADLEKVVQGFFGDRVELRLCRVRADQVGDAVEAAQHTDRIPLLAEKPQPRPQVDVLVPVEPADKRELVTDAYGWVAFVRRPASCVAEPDPPPEPDRVRVYVAEVADDKAAPQEDYKDGLTHDAKLVGPGPLEYPPGTWEFPGGEVATQVLGSLDPGRSPYGYTVTVVALTSKERAPLGSLRASLFAASLDTGLQAPPVYTYQSAEEAIIVIAQPRAG